MKAVISKTKKMQKAERTKDSIYDLPLTVKIIAYTITTLFALACLYPFLLTISASFTDEAAIMAEGYKLIPSKWSLEGYRYIFRNSNQIFWSYGVTLVSTLMGTFGNLLLSALYAYTISRPTFPWKTQFTFFIFFTTLFHGGMLPNYIINTQYYQLRDTLWALVLPGMLSAMHIIMMRTYMQTSVPEAVIESARIDGAKEFRCFWNIVLPMSIPIMATMAMFTVTAYWNNWNRAFLYIVTNTKLIPIQLLLMRLENEVRFLEENAESFGTAADAVKQNLPGETFRMGLVVVVVLPIVVTYPFFQQYFVNGITVGAVKG